MEAVVPRAYWVKQYYFDERGERNEVVQSFADLITHHPMARTRRATAQ